MRRGRRAYYDRFSRFYDRFVALHSRDEQGLARKFLVDQIPVQNAGSVLDLCTGTGTLLTHCRQRSDLMAKFVGVRFFPWHVEGGPGQEQELVPTSVWWKPTQGAFPS